MKFLDFEEHTPTRQTADTYITTLCYGENGKRVWEFGELLGVLLFNIRLYGCLNAARFLETPPFMVDSVARAYIINPKD